MCVKARRGMDERGGRRTHCPNGVNATQIVSRAGAGYCVFCVWRKSLLILLLPAERRPSAPLPPAAFISSGRLPVFCEWWRSSRDSPAALCAEAPPSFMEEIYLLSAPKLRRRKYGRAVVTVGGGGGRRKGGLGGWGEWGGRRRRPIVTPQRRRSS